MFEEEDKVISMEVRQTDMRQGVDIFVVNAVSADGIPKSHQFLISQTDKVAFFKALAGSLDMEITYKPLIPLPMSPVIEAHSTFNTPDDEQTIWRYMSFSKFMSLISSASLWFARADILQVSDPMEGRVPEAQVELNNAYLRSLDFVPMTDAQGNETFSSQQRGEQSVVMNARSEYFDRYHTYINCWHIGDVENFAMWRVYGEDRNCLAIKSTVGDLRRAMGESNNYRIYAGAMNYIDYSDPEVVKGPLPNGFAKYLNKSLYYRYENELRLLYRDTGEVSELIPNDVKYYREPSDSEIRVIPAGVKVPVDVNQLVNDVVLGPDCEPWFIQMLRELSGRENTEGLMDRLGMLNIKLSDVKGFKIPNPPDINW